jgi:hypothetical protein
MLFSTYARLKYAKYFLYLVFDLILTYALLHYLNEGVFDWYFYTKIYLFVLLLQFVFLFRDGLVNVIFMQLNQELLIQGLVNEMTILNYPRTSEGVDCPYAYFKRLANDDAATLALRLNALKYVNQIDCIGSSASGWINRKVYMQLLEKSINQYVLSHP